MKRTRSYTMSNGALNTISNTWKAAASQDVHISYSQIVDHAVTAYYSSGNNTQMFVEQYKNKKQSNDDKDGN